MEQVCRPKAELGRIPAEQKMIALVGNPLIAYKDRNLRHAQKSLNGIPTRN